MTSRTRRDAFCHPMEGLRKATVMYPFAPALLCWGSHRGIRNPPALFAATQACKCANTFPELGRQEGIPPPDWHKAVCE